MQLVKVAVQIWANIQPHDKPSQMTFDLANTSHWKPFFHKGFHNPGLPSIQVKCFVRVYDMPAVLFSQTLCWTALTTIMNLTDRQ